MFKQLLRRLKQEIKIARGKLHPIRKEVSIKHKWYGNDYGGFYVHQEILNNQSIVYSFGIGEDISFDKAMAEQHGCQIFAFDPTPKSVNWVNNQQLPSRFSFFDYGIDVKTGTVNFNLPKNKTYVSGSIVMHNSLDQHNTISVPMKSFSDITDELGHKRINLLKMDIEGSEYHIIESILSSGIEIDQLLLELHERFFTDGQEQTKRLLKSLSEHGYVIFAVSDSFEEVSFIKKAAIGNYKANTKTNSDVSQPVNTYA